VSRAAPAALRGFLAAYDPDVAKLFLATRRAVLAAAPRANELIYDAYNAVSCAYSFSDRLKEALCHVAAYPRHAAPAGGRAQHVDHRARRRKEAAPRAALSRGGCPARLLRLRKQVYARGGLQ
jgi:hypothetical protein